MRTLHTFSIAVLAIALCGCTANSADDPQAATTPPTVVPESPTPPMPAPDMDLCIARAALPSELSVLPADASTDATLAAIYNDARAPLLAGHPEIVAVAVLQEPITLDVVVHDGVDLSPDEVLASVASVSNLLEPAQLADGIRITASPAPDFAEQCSVYAALDEIMRAQETDDPLIMRLALDVADGMVQAEVTDLDDPRVTPFAEMGAPVTVTLWEGTVPTT